MISDMVAKGQRVGPGKTVVSLYFDSELVRRIDRLAAAEDMSRSRFIEKLVSEGIDDSELTVRTMTDPVVAPAMMRALASPEVMRAMLAMIRSELSDDQLTLFQHTMRAAAEQVEKKVGRVSAKRSPSRGYARARDKRHKSAEANK